RALESGRSGRSHSTGVPGSLALPAPPVSDGGLPPSPPDVPPAPPDVPPPPAAPPSGPLAPPGGVPAEPPASPAEPPDVPPEPTEPPVVPAEPPVGEVPPVAGEPPTAGLPLAPVFAPPELVPVPTLPAAPPVGLAPPVELPPGPSGLELAQAAGTRTARKERRGAARSLVLLVIGSPSRLGIAGERTRVEGERRDCAQRSAPCAHIPACTSADHDLESSCELAVESLLFPAAGPRWTSDRSSFLATAAGLRRTPENSHRGTRKAMRPLRRDRS